MSSEYLYLLINIVSIIIPLAWSFERKVFFIQYWKAALSAILITMILFIPWDIYFTHIGVWGFNDKYLIGVNLFGLPVEEYLFFVCIPYASLFTHEALKYYIPDNPLDKVANALTYFFILILFILIGIGYSNWYTITATVLALLVISVLKYFIRPKSLSRYFFSYLLILIPFFIVNGTLTGSLTSEPVVWYNNDENLNFRLGTIPIEDTIYGLSLLLINMSLFEYFKTKIAFK
jgi:lycopene cyclase domain-containing protein